MSYTYDISTSQKDKQSTICLFTTHTISAIVTFFISTFLVAQFYVYNNNIFAYIKNVCMFEGISYIVMAIFMIPFSYLVEKTNRVWIYRFANILRAALIVLIIFINESNVMSMLYITAVLNGLSYAVYYASYNTIKQEMVSRKSMRIFSVICHCADLIVRIVLPILLGALIDAATFSKVSIYVAALCVFQIAVSFGVHSKKPANSNYNLKQYFTKLRQNPEIYSKIKALYWGAFIYGFTSIVTTLINICILMQFGTNFSLGALSSLFSAISMITILLFNKYTRRGKRSSIYITSAIFTFLCTLVFAVYPTIWTLIVYNLGVAATSIIYKTVYDVYRNGILKEAGLYSEITEHQSMTEMFMEFARIISYMVLILLALFQSLVIFKIFLCISVLSCSGTLIFLLYFEKTYFSAKKESAQQEQPNTYVENKDKTNSVANISN